MLDPLPLVPVPPTPLTALLGRIPVLRDLVPAPQCMHLGEVAAYRVQLRVQTRQYCGLSVCYEALTDAAP